MQELIEFIFKNLSFLLVFVALLGPLVHFRVKHIRERKPQAEIAISYVLFFGIGLQGFFAFWGHAFFPDMVAKSIGWAPSPHFQLEMAFTNLSLGILGVMSPWRDRGFRLAAIISTSIILLGCSYGHLRDIIMHANYAPNNAGIVLFMDTVYPFILILLAYLSREQGKKKR